MSAVYVNYSGTPVILQIPAGQTAEEVAASLGVTSPDDYSEINEVEYPPVYQQYGNAFSLSEGVLSFDLDVAKADAKQYLVTVEESLASQILVGVAPDLLLGQASLPLASRLPEYQDKLDTLNARAVALSIKQAEIDSATTVEEVNNISNPPTGILFTGRGSGLGPEDLNVSYYVEFNSLSMDPPQTELYVPGTNTTIPYGSGGEGKFDSIGNCFNPGDYLIQIRETATSRIIAEFEVPLNPAGQDVPFGS